MVEPIAVEVVCPCQGTPHDHDTVFLRRTLPLAQGVALQSYIAALSQQLTPMERADLNGKLAEALLLYGVEDWTFVTERGDALPVTETTIRERLLSDFELSTQVADEAADYYSELIIRPLAERVSNTSRSSVTEPSTPANDSSGSTTNGKSRRRKQSRPSLTSTTQTGVTETTSLSLGGASRS